jgi:hypothetical protein
VDITRAFTYVFDDEDWVGKLAMVLVWTVIGAIPVIGLLGFAALAGYTVLFIKNMRQGSEKPLPRWDNIGALVADGANVLIAAIVYNLGNMVLACGAILLAPSFTLAEQGRSPSVADGAMLAVLCCLTIVILAYNLIIWPLLAIGLIRYAETGQLNSFFKTGSLFAILNRHLGDTVQWMVFSIFGSVVIGLIALIPCVGWIAAPAISLPVQAHLLGQYARLLAQKPKATPKRT